MHNTQTKYFNYLVQKNILNYSNTILITKIYFLNQQSKSSTLVIYKRTF